MDIFIEYIVKQRKTPMQILAAAGMIFASVILIFLSFILLSTPVGSFVLLIDAGILYLCWFGITSFNVEFEYSVTNGELDIDKITNKRKRKKIINFKAKELEIMAPVGMSQYSSIENGTFNKVVDASTKNVNDTPYYAVFSTNGERFKVVFNPTQKMLDSLKVFAPRQIM